MHISSFFENNKAQQSHQSPLYFIISRSMTRHMSAWVTQAKESHTPFSRSSGCGLERSSQQGAICHIRAQYQSSGLIPSRTTINKRTAPLFKRKAYRSHLIEFEIDLVLIPASRGSSFGTCTSTPNKQVRAGGTLVCVT